MGQWSLLLVQQEGCQMAQLDVLPPPQILLFRPSQEFLQQPRVGFLRLFGLAPLVAQVLQEILAQLVHKRSPNLFEARCDLELEQRAAGVPPVDSTVLCRDAGSMLRFMGELACTG